MSSLSSNAFPSLAFSKKSRTLDDEVRDPLAISSLSPAFDWADDVEQEFYSDSNPDLSTFKLNNREGDVGAGSPKVDRPFPSCPRVLRESGYSLTARSEEDGMGAEEVGSGSTAIGSTDARGLIDVDRMFASSCPPRGYRVASVPSLCVIEEGDEETENDLESTPSDATDADTTISTVLDSRTERLELVANGVESLRSSLTCVANADGEERGLATDDPDSGWVWVDVEDVDKEARELPLTRTRARPSRLRAPS